MEIVNGFQLLSDFTKSSISDVWLSSKCASESHVEETVILNEWVGKYFVMLKLACLLRQRKWHIIGCIRPAENRQLFIFINFIFSGITSASTQITFQGAK